MTIRTVEVTPAIYAQGELISEETIDCLGHPMATGIATVEVDGEQHTGKLVECLKKCTKDAEPYQ